jgi:hypothetical protein
MSYQAFDLAELEPFSQSRYQDPGENGHVLQMNPHSSETYIRLKSKLEICFHLTSARTTNHYLQTHSSIDKQGVCICASKFSMRKEGQSDHRAERRASTHEVDSLRFSTLHTIAKLETTL